MKLILLLILLGMLSSPRVAGQVSPHLRQERLNASIATDFPENNRSFSWQPTALANLAINALSASQGGTLYAGSEQDGVFRSNDDGSNWTQINNGLTNLSVYALEALSDTRLFAGTNGSGVFYSQDGGNTWLPRNIGLTHQVILKLASAPDSSLLAGTQDGGIYRSVDGGISWFPYNAGIPGSSTVYDIAIRPDGNILAATRFNGVYTQGDGNLNWDPLGLPNVDIRALLAIPSSGLIVAGAWYDGIYYYDAASAVWVASNLPNTHVMDFAEQSDRRIFAATHGWGVYVSEDGGYNWVPQNDGLPNVGVWCLIHLNGYMFAGTSSSGVYRGAETTPTGLSGRGLIPSAFELSQNYPNPFNPTTTVPFRLEKPAGVRLIISNAAGQIVRTLDAGFRESGDHQLRIEAGSLPSGVYFYTLQAGDLQATRRMTLLR